MRMQIWGGYPAGKRNIYSTDENQNVTFPASITSGNSVISTNYQATNAYYLNGTSYFLNSTNGGIYTNARFESAGIIYASGGNSSNWNTAYSWGNHASVGYLTSLPSHNHDDRYYTETESDGRFQPLENQRLSTGNSPTFVDIYSNNWFRNNSNNTGLYNQANGNHFYSRSGTQWGITSNGSTVGSLMFYRNHESVLEGQVYFDTSGFGLLNRNADWAVRSDRDNTSVRLYHSGAEKLRTDGSGAYVTGRLDVSNYIYTPQHIIAKNIQGTYQVLNLDTPKEPGLYQYDGGIGGTQPAGTDWFNVKTIEIGVAGRYSQFVMPYNNNRIFYRSQVGGTWLSYAEVITSENIGSQSVNYATTAGALSSMNISQFTNNSGYITSSSLSSYLPLAGGTMSGKIFTASFGSDSYGGAFEIRERGYVLATQDNWSYSPAISFHWGNRHAKRLGMRADGLFAIEDEPIALRSWVSSQGFLTSINSTQVTNALGYTPYNSSNPNGYVTSSGSVNYATTAGSAPNGSNINNNYDVTAGVGNGLRFWNGSNGYKISMGVGSLYQYGPVSDYSIKMQMNDGDTGRGFVWGRESYAPIAALNSTSGDMQIAGSLRAAGHLFTSYNGNNILLRTADAGSDAGILAQNSNGAFKFQIYGNGGDYGFLNGNWAGWDIRKTISGAMYMNNDSTYYLQTNSTSNFVALNIQGNAVVHAGNIGSQTVSYATYLNPLSGDNNYKLAYTANGARTNAGEWGRAVMYYVPNGQTYGIRVDRADYADSAGAVAWTNVSSRPTALSQFSNDLGNYGGWLTTGGKAADSELLDGVDSAFFVRGTGGSAFGKRTTGLSGDSTQGLPSGFYDGSGMSNMPTSDWYHLIVNAHQNSYGSNQYEFQLANSFWDKSNFYVRNISPGDVGAWRTLVHSGNIGSQSVNYANSAGSAGSATSASQLTKYGDIYGQDWNTYYVSGKLIASSVLGMTGPNKPPTSYDYGVALSYGEAGGPLLQWYFPENAGNGTTIFRKGTYRTGYNGNWSTWKTLVEQEGNTCTIVGGVGAGLEVHGNPGYNQDPLTYFLLRGAADTSWKAFKVRLTGDAGGQDIEFRRIAENGADSRMWYVPRGGNTVNFEYPIVQPSDSRLKDNIIPISTPVEKIKALSGVEFDWNSGEQVGTHDVGLIAQDVEAVLPEAVTTQEDGYKNLAYTKVIPLLVEAMKEQQTMIEALRAEIELLKHK
jgi:hypothetical protein